MTNTQPSLIRSITDAVISSRVMSPTSPNSSTSRSQSSHNYVKPQIAPHFGASTETAASTDFEPGEQLSIIPTISPSRTLDDTLSQNFSTRLASPPRQPGIDSLVGTHSGYKRLAELSSTMQQTQALLARGMRAANSSFANNYLHGKSKLLGIVGINFEVPNLRETVGLQLQNVREYNNCIHEIISQTQSEINSTAAYVVELAKDLSRLYGAEEHLRAKMVDLHPSQSLRELELAISSPQTLDVFFKTYETHVNKILMRGDCHVAQRGIVRKKEYLRHAYGIQLLLINSLTAAKKVAVDAGCYGSMLERVSASYFSLGCNSSQLGQILDGLDTMQQFTDSMQESVSTALQRLDQAVETQRTSVGGTLERAVYKLRG